MASSPKITIIGMSRYHFELLRSFLAWGRGSQTEDWRAHVSSCFHCEGWRSRVSSWGGQWTGRILDGSVLKGSLPA
jgi:hypothetical protein